MIREQTAQQLELAAQILRTGHPFEVRHDTSDQWHASLGVNPAQAVLQDWHIRLVLATPPDNRPLHNPDNLTAEAVGVGYRLALPEESGAVPHDFWDGDTWKKAKLLGPAIFAWCRRSCRLPLPVPWPEPEKTDPYAELEAAHAAGKVIQYRPEDNEEWSVCRLPRWSEPLECYRIKPEEPVLQLPPPPPGVQWIKGEWKSGDLPQGTRPLAVGEHVLAGDEWKTLCEGTWLATRIEEHCVGRAPTSPQIRRTTRPLTFEHAGKMWTWHRPGDPMPCDGDRDVCCLVTKGGRRETNPAKGHYMGWSVTDEKLHFWGVIIGWRYAEPQTKTVPLGPEDVPSGSVFRGAGEAKDPDDKGWCLITSCSRTGIRYWRQSDSDPAELPWKTLHESGAQINRSLSKGQWNPDAWEPCSKTIPA